MPRFAASLAYYAMISFAPLLVIVVAIVGFAFGSEEARRQVLQQADAQVGPQGARIVASLLANIAAPKRGLLAMVISIAVILIGASGLFCELQDQLNTIWGVRQRAGGHQVERMLRSRLKTFAIVIGIGFLMTLSVLASIALTAAGKRLTGWIPVSAGAIQLGDYLFSLFLATILFALIYRFVPDRIIPWRHIFSGAVITAVLFVAGKVGIGYYLAKASVGSAYGAAGSIVVVLVWLYYSSQVFLIGAIFTHTYARASSVNSFIHHRPPRKAA